MSGFVVPPPSESGDYRPAPEGNHAGVVVAVTDLLLQCSRFEGELKWAQKVQLAWEVEAEGERFVVGHVYTLSLHPKGALAPVVALLLGKEAAARGCDLTQLAPNGFSGTDG
jgi:hypothetical protein